MGAGVGGWADGRIGGRVDRMNRMDRIFRTRSRRGEACLARLNGAARGAAEVAEKQHDGDLVSSRLRAVRPEGGISSTTGIEIPHAAARRIGMTPWADRRGVSWWFRG